MSDGVFAGRRGAGTWHCFLGYFALITSRHAFIALLACLRYDFGCSDGLGGACAGWNVERRWASTKDLVEENLDSFDTLHDEATAGSGDVDKRAFAYFLLGSGRFFYASAVRLLVIKLVGSLSAAADVLALASTEVDLSAIGEGATVTIKWRGKPVFIKRRTEAEIKDSADVNVAELRDPQADADRAQKPEWLVVIGVCTHLGCVPLSNAGEYHGWYCPCHGSHYDVSGRIRKGPAPLNLEVPPYSFVTDSKLLIG